ncbi:MAG: hypothetical protein NC084_06235 [Bacteroides sp.]|nr:hypothetical protein [Eubacterium sp.]MCM1418176.1 hypothetical protein [Roseburia sp.]MCM1462299.1 hypothetical protein [Bacteroides sp.]
MNNTTSYQQIYEWFFSRIEKDEEFFRYYDLTAKDAIRLAKRRASNYLEEAIGLIKLKALPQVDFNDRTHRGFNFQFNAMERILIPSLMYEMYLDRDIAYLKLYNVNFTSTDIRVFDPSNARKTYLELYQTVRDYNKQLIDDYKNTDRTTGKFRKMSFKKYDIRRDDD